jgi:hypothetical protein
MQPIYEGIAENISTSPQLLGLEEYFRKSKRITIVGFGSGLSTLLALRSKPESITVYDHTLYDLNDYIELAHDMGVNLIYKNVQVLDEADIPESDVVYIDGFYEGNYTFSVCQKLEKFTTRYIILNNTYTYGHIPDPTVRLGEGGQPIGMIFGINHFLQLNDPWHIADNLYWEPGLTVLYRRKDITDVIR